MNIHQKKLDVVYHHQNEKNDVFQVYGFGNTWFETYPKSMGMTETEVLEEVEQ